MDWIKRNLYFLIGSLVALALMGLAGWYLYSKWQLNNDILGKLDEQYTELKRLNGQNPHPGSDKVNNIEAAREQQKELRAYMQKANEYFQRCPPIPVPESGKLTSQEYSSALSRTIDALQREAGKASVALPPKDSSGQTYSFSFAAQRERLAYAPGSLEPLSVQLAEVKAICGVLCQAKINSLDNIRRERVSDDDLKGPQTDYLSEKSVTNELAVLTPYEVSFRCFSPELASVLAGFAGAPCGLLVKTINVESAPATATAVEEPGMPAVTAVPGYAPPPQAAPSADRPISTAERFAQRYGMRGRGPVRPAQPPPAAYVPPPVAPVPGAASRGGLQIALDEKQLKVTLMLEAVKPVVRK
jgi:hypothetical protein